MTTEHPYVWHSQECGERIRSQSLDGRWWCIRCDAELTMQGRSPAADAADTDSRHAGG